MSDRRKYPGRPPKFRTPEDLAEKCEAYFQWVEDNPLHEDKLVTFQGSASHEPVQKMRAMTVAGLCLHLGIGEQTWRDYAAKPDFSGVTSWADRLIRTQKFEGAAADLLSPNIIARDLGLADKSESKVDANGGLAAVLARIGASKG